MHFFLVVRFLQSFGMDDAAEKALSRSLKGVDSKAFFGDFAPDPHSPSLRHFMFSIWPYIPLQMTNTHLKSGSALQISQAYVRHANPVNNQIFHYGVVF